MSLTNSDLTYLKRLKQEIVFSCPICLGSGKNCPCQERFSLEIKKAQSRIPIKYRNFNLATITMPDSKNVKSTVTEYINNMALNRKEGNGLFLWGETGVAKSSFGCIILIAALERGYTAYFTDLNECVSLTTGSWFDEDKKREFEKHILEADFLVIDDVGGKEVLSKSNGEMIQTTFTSLFKNRCDSLLPTVMTSNLSPTDLNDKYGDRLYSIACEHLQTVKCNGIDFRQEIIAKGKENS